MRDLGDLVCAHSDRHPRIGEEQRAVLRQAVEAYGLRSQMAKVAEELRELADECDKACRAETMPSNLAHERADVAIVLWQFDNLLLPSLLPAVEAKIISQVERLAGRLIDDCA